MNTEVNPFEPPKAALEHVATPEDAPALWNPDAAGAWSIFLTPIFGSVLVRKNWQAIGDPAKTRAGMIWLAVSILVFAFAVIVFPLTGFLYLIVWYFAWQRPQTQYIRERWGKDYPRKGWAIPLVSGVVIYAVVIFGLSMLAVALFSVGAR